MEDSTNTDHFIEGSNMNTKTQQINLLNILRQNIIESGVIHDESDFNALAKLHFRIADICRQLSENKDLLDGVEDVGN